VVAPHLFHVFLCHVDVVEIAQVALADDFLSGVSGELFHSFVEDEYLPLGIHHDDAVHRALDYLFQESARLLVFPLEFYPRSDITRCLHDPVDFTILAVDWRNGHHIESHFAVLVKVLLIIAQKTLFLELFEAMGDIADSSIFGARLVQAVSDLIAVSSDHIFVTEPLLPQEGSVYCLNRHIPSYDHDPVGKRVEHDLGMPFHIADITLALQFQLRILVLRLEEIPEKSRSPVVEDRGGGRLIAVDRVQHQWRAGELYDQIEPFQLEEILASGGCIKAYFPGIFEPRRFRTGIRHPEDLHPQPRPLLPIQKLQQIEAGHSAANDSHIEREIRLFPPSNRD